MERKKTSGLPSETWQNPVPDEICRGTLMQVIFDGRATSDARIEALLDRIDGTRP